MSKVIKQMEMDALKQTFQGVQDMVLFNAPKLTAQQDNQLRLALRKKNIRLQVVKNSLARKVFDGFGIRFGADWVGPTVVAWGGDSLAGLSRELETAARKYKVLKFKAAVAEGQEISFDQALKMPTRAEAIGAVVAAIIGPASQIAGQLVGPAGQIASQIQTISEKKEGASEGEAPALTPA